VAFFNQPFSQFGAVVDLTVADENERFVLIENRLVPGFQVNDAEPRLRQGHRSAVVVTLIVGTPVMERSCHGADTLPLLWVRTQDSGNSAHGMNRLGKRSKVNDNTATENRMPVAGVPDRSPDWEMRFYGFLGCEGRGQGPDLSLAHQ
jgi:hypothetical protein